LSPASNWNQVSNECGTSACIIANGGCTITLSDDFAMGSYSGEISFSGKAITIWGQGKVLDASGGGRFFNGVGAGSFLELRNAVLQNGDAGNGGEVSVSFRLHYFSSPPEQFLRKELSQIFALIPGGGHATPRAELLMLIVVPMWRSTTAPF
jgi:hypothetical protein